MRSSSPGSDVETVEAEAIRAAQLEPTRFGDLYATHVQFVHALAWSRLHDRSAAEEATAETFLRALRGLPRDEPRDVPFRAWLARICIPLRHPTIAKLTITERVDVEIIHLRAAAGE